MNEVEFKKWLTTKGSNKKVQGDCISRLKRIERELDHCDLDEEYRNDRCEFILGVFRNMGNNDNIKKYPKANLPIGKYYMSTYRHAIKKYIEFCDDFTVSLNQK